MQHVLLYDHFYLSAVLLILRATFFLYTQSFSIT